MKMYVNYYKWNKEGYKNYGEKVFSAKNIETIENKLEKFESNLDGQILASYVEEE